MKIREYMEGDNLTLSLKGDLDDTTSSLLEERMELILAKDVKKIYLDMEKVRYVSSIGIRVLILSYKKAVKLGKKIVLAKTSDKVREILKMVGILSIFSTSGDEG